MSPTEKKARRRFHDAIVKCHRQEFNVDDLDTSKPREVRAWAIDARKQWERRPGREADAARVALDVLASAAQGWADVHERGERERAAQAAKKAPPPRSLYLRRPRGRDDRRPASLAPHEASRSHQPMLFAGHAGQVACPLHGPRREPASPLRQAVDREGRTPVNPTEKALDNAARLTIGRVEQGTCYACGLRPVDPKRRITCGPCYDEADARSRAEVDAVRAEIAAEKGATK